MKLDLRKLPVFLISPGTGKYEQRVSIVMHRLVSLGFQDIRQYKSVIDTNSTDSLTHTNIEILTNNIHSTPFIILEDDCGFTDVPLEIELPDDTDALYLGISKWVYPYSFDTLGRGYHIRENQPYDFSDIESYPNIVKLTGTTSTHGILFLSQHYATQFIQQMNKVLANHTPHDLVFATMQKYFNVFALKTPLVYQDVSLGGQEAVTRLVYTSRGFR